MKRPNSTVYAVLAHGPMKKPSNSLISILDESNWKRLGASEMVSGAILIALFTACDLEIVCTCGRIEQD